MSNKLPHIICLRITILTITAGLLGCNNLGNSQNNPNVKPSVKINQNLPRVVATTSVLCNLTKQVAGNTVNTICLIPPNSDPQLYRPKLEDRQAIERARLILYNGYNLEPNLIKIIRATKNRAPKIAVAQIAVPKPQISKESGKALADPYIWHDAKNGSKMVDVISSNLRKILPKNAALYSNNAKKVKNELTQLDSWVKSRVNSIPDDQRKLVTAHSAMNYYAKAYGFSVVGGVQGINTNQKPTDARIKAMVKGIKQANIPTIFAETTVDSKLIQSVAKQAQVKVSGRKLYTNGMGQPGKEAYTYQKMMTANTRTIVEGLGGTYLMFEAKR
jgi:manganese/iron transport system substrate-binding protein